MIKGVIFSDEELREHDKKTYDEGFKAGRVNLVDSIQLLFESYPLYSTGDDYAFKRFLELMQKHFPESKVGFVVPIKLDKPEWLY